jgi:hypothetical protein
MTSIRETLAGGDRRSSGRADEVVAGLLADPAPFGVIFLGLLDSDAVIRMRSAHVFE